jgi:hypothetical protein
MGDPLAITVDEAEVHQQLASAVIGAVAKTPSIPLSLDAWLPRRWIP